MIKVKLFGENWFEDTLFTANQLQNMVDIAWFYRIFVLDLIYYPTEIELWDAAKLSQRLIWANQVMQAKPENKIINK